MRIENRKWENERSVLISKDNAGEEEEICNKVKVKEKGEERKM